MAPSAPRPRSHAPPAARVHPRRRGAAARSMPGKHTLQTLRIALGLLLGAVGLLAAPTASAAAGSADAMVTEVFTVGYRPVEEVVALIRPLVPAPGSVGGMRDKLVVRTSASNMAEIRHLLDSVVNRTPANLQISVRSSLAQIGARSGVESYGTSNLGGVEIGRGEPSGSGGLTIGDSRSGVRIVQTHSADDDLSTQRVRVLEGQEAFISAGQSVPVADRTVVIGGFGTGAIRQGVRYRDATSGFYVRPRLAGEQVTLEIRPHRTRPSREGGGAFDVAGASTTVSGRLGEWISIGGVSGQEVRSERGITAATRGRSSTDYSVQVKVDRLN